MVLFLSNTTIIKSSVTAFAPPSHLTIKSTASAAAATTSYTTALNVGGTAPSFGGGVSNTIDITKRAIRDIPTMDNWSYACGVQRANGVQLESTNVEEVCLFATQDIAANSPVLFVPNQMILSGVQFAQQPEFGRVEGPEILLSITGEQEYISQFYLLCKILKEYENGVNSPWYPYLNSLPRQFNNGGSMTQWCTTCLPPYVGKLASRERIRFSKFFQALKQIPYLDDRIKRDRSIVKWAYQIATTRSIASVDNGMIVPMIDMFDHATYPNVQLQFDQDGNCCAYSTENINAGTPLTISYGDPTNPSYLLARYGFLDESSPATFCKILINNPSQQLVDIGYDHSKLLFYKDTGDVSQEVWDVLLYQILENVNPNEQQQFFQAHMNGDINTKQAFHQHYYSQTSAALQSHINEFLLMLDGLNSRASARLMSKKSNKHPRLPLILEHNAFVRETFLKVQSKL